MMTYCKLLILLTSLLLCIHVSLSTRSEWSECSRSCGTGITYRTIPCHNGDCTGTEKEYQTCNKEECPLNSIDFRTEQCSKIEEYSISVNNMSSPCKLMCAMPGHLPIDRGTVVDGTSCGVSGICVAGTCVPVGCDGVPGSNKKIDKCGRCGDVDAEAICLHVPCNIEKAPEQENEYHVKLPVGSSRVQVLLKSSTCDFLALSSQNKTFYFNQTPTFTISGNKFVLDGDKLFSYGPLQEEILIKIQDCQANQIGCKYFIPVHEYVPVTFGPANFVDYKWVVSENYTECSKTCGTGIQTAEIYCKNIKTNERTKSTFCSNLSKTELVPSIRNCSMPACTFEWKESNWEMCSKSCGGGIKKRDVACVQVTDNGFVVANSTASCYGERPKHIKTCNHHLCHNHWHVVTTYSECSNSCGEGIRRREVICLNAYGLKIDESNCNILTKPNEVEKCIGDMCSYQWIQSNWSNCSVDCGHGIQTRIVECQRVADNVTVNETFCLVNISTPKPKTQKCCRGSCCVGTWGYDDWGKCEAAECYAEGYKYRNVYCYYGNRLARDHPEIKCNLSEEPPAKQACNKTKGCPPKWIVLWSPCNKECVKTGTLICIHGDKIVANSSCPADRPSIAMKCDHPCKKCSKSSPICHLELNPKDDPKIRDLLCSNNCCKCDKR